MGFPFRQFLVAGEHQAPVLLRVYPVHQLEEETALLRVQVAVTVLKDGRLSLSLAILSWLRSISHGSQPLMDTACLS